MKLVTFTVPCYNSADYMRTCIDSLLPAKDEAEIIIIDDGSKDDTGKIADEYAEKYPDTVKVVHQENGGHGAGINAGIANATGIYFKIIDSDDWVEADALNLLMDKLREAEKEGGADLVVCNYCYYHKGIGINRRVAFDNVFPKDRIFSWDEVKKFKIDQYMMIHSNFYRLDVIKKADFKCPEHVSYEDNYFLYCPLPYCERLLYLDIDLYMYLIGRDGQSVARENLVRKRDQQAKVAELTFAEYDFDEIKKKNKKLFRTMYRESKMLIQISATLIRLAGGKESEAELRAFKDRLYAENKKWAGKILKRSETLFVCIPGAFGRWLAAKPLYSIAHKVVKFN